MLQLTIRIFAVRKQRKSINDLVRGKQHVTGETSVTGHNLQRIVNIFTIIAASLMVFATLCLVFFALFDHLTWTILSNNFVMIVGTVSSNLISLRINKIGYQIRLDQHKAVIFESSLLLHEAIRPTKDLEEQKIREKRISLFLKCLKKTESFSVPSHIEIPSEIKDKFDLITNLEMMSYV